MIITNIENTVNKFGYAEVRGIVGHVVNSTMTHVSSPAILERIMEDPGYCDCDFGQIKHLLKGIYFYIYELK